MFGNSGNTRSNVQNNSRQQYGKTVDKSSFSLLTVNLFSHNNHSLNRHFSIRKNSSRLLFAIALIMLIVKFSGGQKYEMKIKSR